MEETIIEISAYKIGNMCFENKKEAERYKYERIDPVVIGDWVSLSGGFRNVYGVFGLEGIVFDIIGDEIWFYRGLPDKYKNYSKEFIKTGGIYMDGKLIEWDVMSRHRNKLFRKRY